MLYLTEFVVVVLVSKTLWHGVCFNPFKTERTYQYEE